MRTSESIHPMACRWASRARAAVLVAGIVSAGMGVVGGCDEADSSEPSTVAPFNATVPADFVAHKARSGGVTIKAPPGWHETSTSGNVVLNLLTGQPGSSVNLVSVPATPGQPLQQVMAELPGQLRHEFADFELLRSDYIIFNDLPAGRLVYRASRGGFKGKLAQVVMAKGARNYILTYTASPEHFDADYPAFEQLITSTEIR